MSAMAPQITSFAIVNSTVYSGADQRKHQSSASLAFVRGIFDDVIMCVPSYAAAILGYLYAREETLKDMGNTYW